MSSKSTPGADHGAADHDTDQRVSEVEWSGSEVEVIERLPGRGELLVEAIRLVRAALRKEETPTRASVGNLVQLLKLQKELESEEQMPTEVQLVWNEIDEELFADD